MIHVANRSRWLQAVLLTGFGALLVWQIVTRSLVAYLATEAPAVALTLRPDEPTALVSLADAMLNPQDDAANKQAPPKRTDQARQRGAGESDRIGGWAEMALKAAAKPPLESGDERSSGAAAPLSDADKALIQQRAEMALLQGPLNARALRILGQLADGAGDKARAARLMRAAADQSLSESVAVYWLMQSTLAAKDYPKTVSYADTFLRKRPQLLRYVTPVLSLIAESGDKAGMAALDKALAESPAWRPGFLADLPGKITDARTPLNLMLSLKSGTAPPTTRELGYYLNFLVGRKLYELAYYTWLQFLPADQLGRIGYLANPGFETEPSGLPFDWVIAQGAGATVDIAAVPGTADAHALLVDLGPGRVDFGGVKQVLMLSPGTYRLKGMFKGETRGKRGLQWTIACAGSNEPPLGKGPMFVGIAPTWTKFEFSFSVPDAKCRAQELKLALAARSASEQLASGSIWYDELQISRLEGPAQ